MHEAVLVELLQRLVREPSQQSDLMENDRDVKRFISDVVAPQLTGIGAELRFDGMGNLIAEAGPRSAERSLLFLGYAMTHPASNMKDPFSATLVDTPRGQTVRGRGVAEQKTALAAALAAFVDAVTAGNLDGRLVFALTTAGETGRHDAIASVMNELGYEPTFAIVLIGTDNRVAIGNKGRIDFDVIIRGQACHSSMPWNGINAMAGAWRVLKDLEDLDLKVPEHPEFGPATLTPTAVESHPKATHTVPDTVRLTFDRRLLPGEDPQGALEAITTQVSLPDPWKIKVKLGPVMYPNEVSVDGPLFQMLKAAFSDAGANAPAAFHCNFALDAGYFARRNIESVMLGPGEVDQFHSDEEHVLVADLVEMSRVYRALIDHYLAPK